MWGKKIIVYFFCTRFGAIPQVIFYLKDNQATHDSAQLHKRTLGNFDRNIGRNMKLLGRVLSIPEVMMHRQS